MHKGDGCAHHIHLLTPDMSHHFTIQSAKLRASVLAHIREFFRQRDVLEVDTPLLSHGTSTDCYLDIFETRFHPGGYNDSDKSTTLYLQTSPELLMKRLLAQGFPDIFQICKVFRNGEWGQNHNHEFTMLEWYRKEMSMEELIGEIAELCISVLGKREVKCVSYQDIFRLSTGIDPLETSVEELLNYCSDKNRPPPDCLEKCDLLNYMMTEFVEPSMEKEVLLFVHNFPAPLAAMAKLNPQNPDTALRFELFHQGLEICNGYEELADCDEQYKRMVQDNNKRLKLNKPKLPVDKRFIESIKHLPPCSGVALGVDRLLMLASNSSTIESVLPYIHKEC
ncbi:EF-P lysine aminoacylase EpmA [Chitinispirillales bacterium ANBcel5]|uniref:EF-P lysine aminoacylase EpmA n=1 Tax=Cellulosispirillum alkaliphilum TaxID=3039283 RepID=UPI002A58536E|nr:EF-P lysine aminoacylase EpmA [Chitinispirillales bacterium ANBcel5]